jgi:hypothetical protein
MEKSLQDIRYGARVLIRRPGFALGVIFILALGIGTATATFSVINSVLLDPLPYGEAHRAVQIWTRWTGFPETWVSYDEYEARRRSADLPGHRSRVYGGRRAGLFASRLASGGGESGRSVALR